MSLLEARATSGRHLKSWQRSALSQARTLYVGLDVHKASIAVASVAKDPEAHVIAYGTMGTRHADIDQLTRKLQSKAKRLVFV